MPYAPRGRTEDGYRLDWRRFGVGEVLPKSGKYQDDRIVDAHLFYYALLRAMARMAAADKRGRFDEALARFPGGGNMPRRSVIDTKAPSFEMHPIVAIFPSLIPTSETNRGVRSPSKIVPLRMMIS